MLKRKLAGVVVAGLLLGIGAVSAAESGFPTSSSEVASSDWYHGDARRMRIDANAGAAEPVFPSSSSEIASRDLHEGDVQRSSFNAGATSAAGSVFPTSANETGASL